MERVNEGSKQVNITGETMSKIVSNIQNVAQIMSDISNASKEQSIGVDQVNRAIVQMDEVTQQNAALVEEAAAAAQSLEDQVRNLSSVVSIFKV